jgi:hypothetical protein
MQQLLLDLPKHLVAVVLAVQCMSPRHTLRGTAPSLRLAEMVQLHANTGITVTDTDATEQHMVVAAAVVSLPLSHSTTHHATFLSIELLTPAKDQVVALPMVKSDSSGQVFPAQKTTKAA